MKWGYDQTGIIFIRSTWKLKVANKHMAIVPELKRWRNSAYAASILRPPLQTRDQQRGLYLHTCSDANQYLAARRQTRPAPAALVMIWHMVTMSSPAPWLLHDCRTCGTVLLGFNESAGVAALQSSALGAELRTSPNLTRVVRGSLYEWLKVPG